MKDSRLTVGQVCKVLGVSRALVRQWESQGKLVAVERGERGVRYYDADAVVALRERRVDAKLEETTRVVAPEAPELATRAEALEALKTICQKAAALPLTPADCAPGASPELIESVALAWAAAAKCAEAIVEATTPTTTITKTTSASTVEISSEVAALTDEETEARLIAALAQLRAKRKVAA